MDHDLNVWRGEFGNSYTERHPIDDDSIAVRIQLFETILEGMEPDYPKSILEVGAGTGNNLRAFNEIYLRTKTPLLAFGTEPNDTARKILADQATAVFDSSAQDLTNFSDSGFDLVFTSGVLIHIPPADHLRAMAEIFRCSKRWIASIEYFNPTLEEVKYRGSDGMMWRRDWGSLWLDNFKVKPIGNGFCWKRTTGLDNVVWFLFEKALDHDMALSHAQDQGPAPARQTAT